MKSDLHRVLTLYMYLFHSHFVLWELKVQGQQSRIYHRKITKNFRQMCVNLSQCNGVYESQSAEPNVRAIVWIPSLYQTMMLQPLKNI